MEDKNTVKAGRLKEAMRRNPPAVMNVQEAAAYLDLGVRTIYAMAGKGTIPALKVAGSWRFPLAALDKWLANGARGNVEDQE